MKKEEVAAEVFIGLGKEARTHTCIPKPSKAVSPSGREISESGVCCWNTSLK